MRKLHCTVPAPLPPLPALLALLHLLAAPAGAQPIGSGGVQFTVFGRGNPVGVEEVTVTRPDGGLVITGSSRLGPPLDVVVRRAEVRYDASGKPVSCFVEGSLKQRLLVMSTTVAGTTATTDITEGSAFTRRTHEIAPDALLLPSVFFGGHEALAARLGSMKVGEETSAYVPGQEQITVRLVSANDERIQTAGATVKARRFRVEMIEPERTVDAEVWADEHGRLVRFSAATQTLDIVRTDVASVSARREVVARPGDEAVRIPANGFTLAGTVSRPSPPPAKGVRLPAVVLVGTVGATDRDETRGGVAVLGQLGSALADAGFAAIRYDRRGVGQSGGRAETATIGDFAEDLRAVVKFLRNRKDVDRDRIAVLGYDEGGSVAMAAAAADEDIKALALAATPGVKGTELVLEKQRAALAEMDLSPEEKQKRIEMQQRVNEAVVTGKGWMGVPPAMRRQAETPWFRSLLSFDPAVPLKRLRQPVLVLHGALDSELGTQHAEALAALAKARKGEAAQKVRLDVIPGVNHLLVPAAKGTVDEYGSLADASVSQDVVKAIAGWLGEVLPPREK